MKAYILSLLAASLVAAIVGILSPSGEGGGIAKHLRLVCALFLLCALLSPLPSVLELLKDLSDGNLSFPGIETDMEEDYRDRLEGALDESARTYVQQMLTESIEEKFSISRGEVKLQIQWDDKGERPTRVTVLLSGGAIWKNPHEISNFVSTLLKCECVCAIE